MSTHLKRVLPAAVLACAMALIASGYSNGPPPRRTGAPGDRTCLDAGCHAGDRFPNSAAIRLETPDRLTYVPGGPRQRWTLRVHDSQARAFGFQMSARLASDAAAFPGGRFHEVDATTQVICEDDRLSGPLGCSPQTLVQFIQHNQPREAGEFALDWTPPESGAGDIVVYVAANASVAGQRSARIHLSTFLVRPAVTDGVVNAASLRRRISPGAWGSVLGTGLSAVTRSWQAEDIRDGVLPAALDGVAVQVDGAPAVVSFISPTRVDFQAPGGAGDTPARIEVLRDGRSAARSEVDRTAIAPGLFVLHDGGRDYAAAVRPDGRAISAASRALPGETILVFGTGLCPAEPGTPYGAMFQAAAPCATPVRLTIGGVEAEVGFAGLVAPGLNQLNAVVPEVPPGDQPLQFEAAGQRAQDRVYLPVRSP